jgi:hypothetical protein
MGPAPASCAGTPRLVWTNPEAHTVTATAARDDGWFAFLDADGTKQRLWFHDTVSAAQRQYRRLGYGPTIGFAPTGELGFVLGKLGTPAIQAAIPPVGAPSRLKLSVVPAFVLP